MFWFFATNQGMYAIFALIHAVFLAGLAFINVLKLYQYTLQLDEKYGEDGWKNQGF